MPRKEPTVHLDILGRLDSKPIKTVGEYLTSKENEKNFMKAPAIDAAADDIESLYIQNKFEHDLVLGELEGRLKQRKWLASIYEQRTRRVLQAQSRLHMRFIAVNNFIRDSDDKRKIAFKKINEEIERHRELTEIVKKKKQTLEDFKKFRIHLKTTCEEYKSYDTVLDNVVKRSSIFKTPKELISRCDAIMMAQGEMVILTTLKSNEIEAMHRRIIDIIKQAGVIFSSLINDLAEMERSYQKAWNACLYWENVLASTKDAIIKAKLKKEQIRDAWCHIYSILCLRKGSPLDHYGNYIEEQGNFIKDEVELLRKVIQECSIRLGTKTLTE